MAVRELASVAEKRQRSRGHFARAWSRLLRKKLAVVCMVTLVVVYLAGIFAAWISPYGYQEQDYSHIRESPSVDISGGVGNFWNNSHIAGTDRAGRDIFTRILWGIQNTVILTVVAMLTGALPIGLTLGLLAGYFGGKIDSLIMRTGEIAAVFPEFFMVIIIASTLGPRIREWVIWLEDNTFFDGLITSGFVDYIVISLALVSFGWIGLARLLRGQILYLRESQHIEAARAIGASTKRIMFLHLLPNAMSPILVSVTMGMGVFIGTEIFLSWIGLGIQPPRPSLGRMLLEAGNIGTLRNEPWMLFAPGFVAWILLLSWNLLGDALNDVFNPRTR